MFKKLKEHKGQGIAVQYVLVFFLVVGVVVSMTTYIRRTLQARMHSARDYVLAEVNAVHSNPAKNYAGNVLPEYEPYYAISQADRGQVIRQTRDLEGTGAGTAEIFTLGIDERTGQRALSEQLPPVNAM